jgi:hypothetical protein
MTAKKSLENRIRGWLPQEPILPNRASSNQATKKEIPLNFQNVFLACLLLAGFICYWSYLSNSWIKFLLLGITLAFGGLWVLAQGKLKRVLKVSLAVMLIFVISFAAFETFMFQNAGYPVYYSQTEPQVSLSQQQMFNASLSQIVQSAQASSTFNLLRFEHGNNFSVVTVELWPYNGASTIGGYVGVEFYFANDNFYAHLYSHNGHQYIVEPDKYEGFPIPQSYRSNQETNKAIEQIDLLGPNWFYSQALQIAQNKTPNIPSVDSIDMTLKFQDISGIYQGFTLVIVGDHHLPKTANQNAPSDEGVLLSYFAPNGTFIDSVNFNF